MTEAMNEAMNAAKNQATTDDTTDATIDATTGATTGTMNSRSISLLICALGGEGGGVFNEWLVDVARRAGYAAQGTSIPGVAQRTGATTYYFETYPVPIAQLGGRKPVFSLNPVPGALDALLSSELLETARCASNGLPSPDRTLVITSSSRTLTNAERSHLGDGRLDSGTLLSLVQSSSRAHHALDMQRIAAEHRTVVSSVMLGAIAASGLLPFDREHYVAAIRAGDRGVAESLAGFDAAWRIVAEGRAQAEAAERMVTDAMAAAPSAWMEAFPPEVRPLAALGLTRVTEYQDAAYGRLYLERLRRVRDAEQAAPGRDASGTDGFAATREAARWLALWMAYDDIARVADLKSRASRHARVRREARAGERDLLRFYDHFKPGLPEVADLLPASLATRLQEAERARIAEGRGPWSFPVKLASHTVGGMLLLRLLAMAKFARRYSSRYAQEQELIDAWLSAVVAGLNEDAKLGSELAQCGRLLKGYGSTHERGRERLRHVLRHLTSPAFGSAQARAEAIARVRAGALADEGGKAFGQALAAVGAPAPALRAQPVRWMPRPPR